MDERFPQAVGGSAASGTATETSDLDLLVVLPEARADVSYVETMRYEGQQVEAFVYGPVALQRWVKKGRTDRRPVLDKLIGEGIALTASADTRSVQEAARTALNEGPGPLSEDELRQRQYSLSGVLDDLQDATDSGETFVLSATACRLCYIQKLRCGAAASSSMSGPVTTVSRRPSAKTLRHGCMRVALPG